jgi:hypothetical protein
MTPVSYPKSIPPRAVDMTHRVRNRPGVVSSMESPDLIGAGFVLRMVVGGLGRGLACWGRGLGCLYGHGVVMLYYSYLIALLQIFTRGISHKCDTGYGVMLLNSWCLGISPFFSSCRITA